MRGILELPFRRPITNRWLNSAIAVVWALALVVPFFTGDVTSSDIWASAIAGLILAVVFIFADSIARRHNFPSNRLTMEEKVYRLRHPIQYLKIWQPPIWLLAYTMFLLYALYSNFTS